MLGKIEMMVPWRVYDVKAAVTAIKTGLQILKSYTDIENASRARRSVNRTMAYYKSAKRK